MDSRKPTAAAPPIVGYARDSDDIPTGISQCLAAAGTADEKLHFDFGGNGIHDTAAELGGVFRDKLLEAFKLVDRADDGVDQNGIIVDTNDDGTPDEPDDVDEMRLPGLININTTSPLVLRAEQTR